MQSRRLMSYFIWACLICANFAIAKTSYYGSGFFQRFENDDKRAVRGTYYHSLNRFLEDQFKSHLNDHEWREVRLFDDKNYLHGRYQLYYRGLRVADQFLNVHYKKEGFIEYAANTLAQPLSLNTSNSRYSVADIEERARLDFSRKFGAEAQYLKVEPVVWLDAAQTPHSAYQIDAAAFSPLAFESYYLDATQFNRLANRRVMRNAQVYKSNPDLTALSSVTLSDLLDPNKLSSQYVKVRRQEYSSGYHLREVDPTVDFSADGDFSTSPFNYDAACAGTTPGDCPNQEFDAVNVYYQLTEFRNSLHTYFTELGVEPVFSGDPLDVIVNMLVYSDSSTTGSNNAAFLDMPCTNDTSVPQCLFFLRPSLVSADICGGLAQFYDLAREANVIVHEYQHYLTDLITGMVPGSSVTNVGDHLHEGYSDFLGASEATKISGEPSQIIGQYSFQECSVFERDISQARVFENSADESEDPHLGGHTWASGLWALRSDFKTEFGNTLGAKNATLLALKSLFYLPVKPGFLDSVDALVRADRDLFSGSHESRIRTLFFDDLKWGGPEVSSVFRNSSERVVEVGFRSCSGVGNRKENDPLQSEAIALYAVLFLVAARGIRLMDKKRRNHV